ncbi:MAG: DUF4349 domain-containing protein [Treponema sp.]|nr:DUF4349 domain-containing protein [Treponema sp.]
MKKKVIILTMLAALILSVSCYRSDNYIGNESRRSAADYEAMPFAISATTPGLPYDDSVRFEGVGFSPEGPGGIEMGRVAPAYKDMSNLFDRLQTNERPLFDTSISATTPDDNRKLTKRANVSIRVENLEAASSTVTELLEKHNGYSASTLIFEKEHYYSLRVPALYFDIFLTEISGIGRTVQRIESIEDVTLQFYDLEGRLESRRELLRTFQSYLRRASNMDEILTVERRIAEIQREIDSTGTQLRNLTNRIDYATIDLFVQGPVAANKNKGNTFGEDIKRLFGGFGEFLSSMAIILLGVVIYGIPSLALLVLLFWLLFGRIGLMKKLWRFVTVKKQE